MSTPPDHIASSIRHLTIALESFCDLYAREAPTYLPQLLASFDAEIARWRERLAQDAPGNTK